MRYALPSLLALLAVFSVSAYADDPAAGKLLVPKPLVAGHQVVTLFPPGHSALRAGPGADKDENFKMNGAGDRVQAVTNIHNPSIELYLAPPDKANGVSVILSPGGGNNTCNVGGEGIDVAKWFNDMGVSCFVHRYRLKPYGSATDALADTKRAVRVIRAHAKEWNVDPNKIGHMGFSAGGEQTARLELTFDDGKADDPDPIERVSCRPDWTVLVYPGWVPNSLDMSKVPATLPPTFLVCAGTGDVFHAKQTVEFYNALFEVGMKTKPKPLNIEMHIYGTGGHGGSIFMGKKPHPFSHWTERFVEWATEAGVMPAGKEEAPAAKP